MNWLSFVSKEEIKLAQDPDWEYEDENPIHGFFPPNEQPDEPRESINEEKITPPELAEKKEENSTFNLTRNNDNPKQHSYNLRPRKKQRNLQQK